MSEDVIIEVGTPAPISTDSPTVSAGDQAQGSAPVAGADQAQGANLEAQTPDSLADKLAEAEKRVKDTQRWGHTLSQENAKLKTDLNVIFNHPVYGSVLREGLEDQVQDGAKVDESVKAAWRDYQTAANDEEAFTKLLTFAEERASQRAMTQLQRTMAEREAQARVAQRNQLAAQTINQAVVEAAPDVPLELFWAMSHRAELETPPEVRNYTDRIAWQVGRAIELSRSVLNPARMSAKQAAEQSAAAQRAAGAMIAPGSTPATGGGGGSAPAVLSFTDQVKAMQQKRV